MPALVIPVTLRPGLRVLLGRATASAPATTVFPVALLVRLISMAHENGPARLFRVELMSIFQARAARPRSDTIRRCFCGSIDAKQRLPASLV